LEILLKGIIMAEDKCPPRPPCEKDDGSQDHRCNTGGDRTPAQKDGDKKRSNS
jgi:hypothetical protein